MKSKLGILGAIVLSLAIAGSAFATPSRATGKIVKKAAAVRTAKTMKIKKSKKHRSKKVYKKAAPMNKTAPAKKT